MAPIIVVQTGSTLPKTMEHVREGPCEAPMGTGTESQVEVGISRSILHDQDLPPEDDRSD